MCDFKTRKFVYVMWNTQHFFKENYGKKMFSRFMKNDPRSIRQTQRVHTSTGGLRTSDFVVTGSNSNTTSTSRDDTKGSDKGEASSGTEDQTRIEKIENEIETLPPGIRRVRSIRKKSVLEIDPIADFDVDAVKRATHVVNERNQSKLEEFTRLQKERLEKKKEPKYKASSPSQLMLPPPVIKEPYIPKSISRKPSVRLTAIQKVTADEITPHLKYDTAEDVLDEKLALQRTEEQKSEPFYVDTKTSHSEIVSEPMEPSESSSLAVAVVVVDEVIVVASPKKVTFQEPAEEIEEDNEDLDFSLL